MSEKLDKNGEWGTIVVRLPPELKGYGPSLIRFFDAMVFKLRRNAHKGKWEAMPLEKAMSDLQGEVGELITAVKNCNTSEILMEGADVANEALIVADIALEARGV